MTALTPKDRALYGAIGAARRWGQTLDRTEATASARAAFRTKFIRDVIAEFPDATPEQVRAMAAKRRHEFYLRLAEASRASRKAKAAGSSAGG